MSGHPVTGSKTKDSPHLPPAGWTPVKMRGKDGIERDVTGYDVFRAIKQIKADRPVKETLHMLATHLDTNRDYFVWPGCQTLATERGVSIRTARRHLRRTEHTKYIRGKEFKGHKTVFELDIGALIHDGELAKRDQVTRRSELLSDVPPESQPDVDPTDPHAWLRRSRTDDPEDPLSWVNRVPPGTSIDQAAELVRRTGRLVLATRDATPAELLKWGDRVIDCWRRAGAPDADAWLETVRRVLEVAGTCQHNAFRWELRGLSPRGQRRGEDRVRDPQYVFLPARWADRVEIAHTHAAGGDCGCRHRTSSLPPTDDATDHGSGDRSQVAPPAVPEPPRQSWADIGAGLMSTIAREVGDDNHAPVDDENDRATDGTGEARPRERGPPEGGR